MGDFRWLYHHFHWAHHWWMIPVFAAAFVVMVMANEAMKDRRKAARASTFSAFPGGCPVYMGCREKGHHAHHGERSDPVTSEHWVQTESHIKITRRGTTRR